MSKPTPAHHKTVAIPRKDIAKGYHGERAIEGLAGLWIIVAAAPCKNAEDEDPWIDQSLISVIVAPARGPK